MLNVKRFLKMGFPLKNVVGSAPSLSPGNTLPLRIRLRPRQRSEWGFPSVLGPSRAGSRFSIVYLPFHMQSLRLGTRSKCVHDKRVECTVFESIGCQQMQWPITAPLPPSDLIMKLSQSTRSRVSSRRPCRDIFQKKSQRRSRQARFDFLKPPHPQRRPGTAYFPQWPIGCPEA
jgi:hypothetical protein